MMFDALPKHHYGLIMADPSLAFDCYSDKGEGRSPQSHYKTAPLAEIMQYPVEQLAAPDCHLFLWTSAPFLLRGIAILQAWGWKYSSVGFTWAKLYGRESPDGPWTDKSFHMGTGHTTRKQCEYCLLGRRGKPKRLNNGIRELIIERVREHSRKPDQAYERCEAYADGPYLDLFSRTDRPNWDVFGDEAGKFGAAA